MNERVFSVLYMFMITLLFTSLVTAVRVFSEERIKTNEKARLQRVILNALDIPVVNGSANDDLVRLFEKSVETKVVEDRTVYAVNDPLTQRPVRYAVKIGGSGFWGPISAIVATDSAIEKILGIEFYRHQETPGLGGRITEQWFTDQFAGLPLSYEPDKNNFFTITPPAAGKRARELDAITGATQTSRAVETFINKEIAVIKGLQEKIHEK